MSTATLFSNEATDLSITVAAATIARVPEDIRVDEGLLVAYLQRATDIGVMAMAQARIHLETEYGLRANVGVDDIAQGNRAHYQQRVE